MYKVMLVDDDYPVLEMLSEMIDWQQLDMQVLGLHENGVEALEHALKEMPDILITDIGMPKMDGIELINRLKPRRPNLRTVILSCHSEFHYAKQAMKLNVQDYILKDTLNPEDLQALLKQFKESLDQEQQLSSRQIQLQRIADRSKSAMRSEFIRSTVHQPIMDQQQWMQEAALQGLDLANRSVLPVLIHVDQYHLARHRFMSESVLQFALENVVDEILRNTAYPASLFVYSSKELLVFYSYESSLKINPYDEAHEMANRIGQDVYRTLKLSLTTILGEPSSSVDGFKQRLTALTTSGGQRFYMKLKEIGKRSDVVFATDDLFARYDEAFVQFRDVLVEGSDADSVIAYWIGQIGKLSYKPEVVKDWILKLLLDLKLKVQSMQYFRTFYSVEVLHKEVPELNALHELQQWLSDYFAAMKPVVGKILMSSQRVEIIDAVQYVSRHMGHRISLDEVAKHLHMNASYFSRLFRKETGETFIEYVTRVKMERAKELLDQTGQPVNIICEQLGYENQSYFIKTFKSHTGVTPLEYRGRRIEA